MSSFSVPKSLLFLLLLVLASAVAAATDTAVLDVTHQKLQARTNYYVRPAIRGIYGGGLTLRQRNRTCPLYVATDRFEISKGMSLKFLPADPTQKFVHESADMNVVFSGATTCVQSTAWTVGNVEVATGRRYVMSGGVTGKPGVETVSNWFKIERYREEYKLVFCPSVCASCKVVCGDLGAYLENGNRWIGLSAVPLAVNFLKAEK